jgi:hypothetical protein
MTPKKDSRTEGFKTVAEVYGPKAADALAKWAIDALVEPPVRIDTHTTRIPASMIERGRVILDVNGIDWRALKGDTRSAERSRRER